MIALASVASVSGDVGYALGVFVGDVVLPALLIALIASPFYFLYRRRKRNRANR